MFQRLFCTLLPSDVEHTVVYGNTTLVPTEEEGESHSKSPHT